MRVVASFLTLRSSGSGVRIDVVNLFRIGHGVAVNAGTLRRKFFLGQAWRGAGRLDPLFPRSARRASSSLRAKVIVGGGAHAATYGQTSYYKKTSGRGQQPPSPTLLGSTKFDSRYLENPGLSPFLLSWLPLCCRGWCCWRWCCWCCCVSPWGPFCPVPKSAVRSRTIYMLCSGCAYLVFCCPHLPSSSLAAAAAGGGGGGVGVGVVVVVVVVGTVVVHAALGHIALGM